ncbi:MAG: hypothetical protein CMJ44_09115 [Pimelobacter sp.]|nr:hypothetical protein [Pimelobacter sp.]
MLGPDHRRRVPDGMSRFLRFRDRIRCTPWCDAPVRHSDHVESAEEGGPTTVANTQGLCETCNHGKQARGWTARPDPGHPARTTGVETTTRAPLHLDRTTRAQARVGRGRARSLGPHRLSSVLHETLPAPVPCPATRVRAPTLVTVVACAAGFSAWHRQHPAPPAPS